MNKPLQPLLFPPELPSPVDPKVRPQDVKALSATCAVILHHLQLKRSCTVTELEQVAGVRRVAPRILDLKKWLEAIGSTTTIDGRFVGEETREYLYELKEQGASNADR